MEKRFILLSFMLFIASASVLAVCEDIDGDTYVVDASQCTNPPGIDCNDNNPNINPGVLETGSACSDSLDNDCNGYIDSDDPNCGCEDQDFDGYQVIAISGTDCGILDCDDTNAFMHPGATEICGDGLDNDCDGTIDNGCSYTTPTEGTGATNGVCAITGTYWADCDGNEITSANEGDSVFLIVATNNCDTDSEVDYTINEHNDGQAPYQMETGSEQYINVDGNTVSYAGSWLTAWLDDGTTDPDPEYYFDFNIIAPGGATYQGSSGTGDPLVVTQCPANNPNCGVECTLSGGFLNMGGGSGGFYDVNATTFPVNEGDCVSSWDCSQVVWSDCDPDTGKQARDTSQCVFTGAGNVQCQANSMAELTTERSCAPSTRSATGKRSAKESEVVPEQGGFPWGWAIFIGLIVILTAVGLTFYLKLRKGTQALAGTSTTEVKKVNHEVTPFAKVADLNAVVGYIKLAKQRGIPDQKIKEMLLRSGWNMQQIEYAFKSINVGMTSQNNHKHPQAK